MHDSSLAGFGIEDSAVGGSGWADGREGPQPMELGAPDSAPQQAGQPATQPSAVDPARQVAPETLPGLRLALGALFGQHSVVDLPNLRCTSRVDLI